MHKNMNGCMYATQMQHQQHIQPLTHTNKIQERKINNEPGVEGAVNERKCVCKRNGGSVKMCGELVCARVVHVAANVPNHPEPHAQ